MFLLHEVQSICSRIHDKWKLLENVILLVLWQRVKTTIYLALVLDHLHYAYTFPITDCDIKSSNMLLDEDIIACVTDFWHC